MEEMEVARMWQSINHAFLYLLAFPVLLARPTPKTADETTQLDLATKAHAHDLLRLAHHQAARGERAGAPRRGVRRRPLSAIRERARGVAQAISRGDKRRVSVCDLPIDKRSVMVAALAGAPRHRCPP